MKEKMFYYYNPVKIIHGCDAICRVTNEIRDYSNITLIFSQSFKNNVKAFSTLHESLKNKRIQPIQIKKGEPTNLSVSNIVNKICPKTDFILGVGGGSILDITKAIAFCHGNKIDPIELGKYNLNTFHKSTKFGLICTRPGSGSEGNNAFILTNSVNKIKNSFFSQNSFPLFSIHDPSLYESLSITDYYFGLLDALAHIIDQYLISRPKSIIQDHLATSYFELGLKMASKQQFKSPEAFMNLAWFGSLVSSGILSRGVKTSWLIHELAHSLGAAVNIPHTHAIRTILCSMIDLNCFPLDKVTKLTDLIKKPQIKQISPTNRRKILRLYFEKTFIKPSFNKATKNKIQMWGKCNLQQPIFSKKNKLLLIQRLKK